MTGLRSVGSIKLISNLKLRDLNGLMNVSPPLSSLTIQNNIRLATCEIELVCQLVPKATTTIAGNAFGCADKADLEWRCSTAGCPLPASHNYNPNAAFLASCMTCTDGIQNGDETDVDCGGALCMSCFCEDTLVIMNQII